MEPQGLHQTQRLVGTEQEIQNIKKLCLMWMNVQMAAILLSPSTHPKYFVVQVIL
jgi:hypothetical protein